MNGDKKLQNVRASPDKGEKTTRRLDRTLTVMILFRSNGTIPKNKTEIQKVAHYFLTVVMQRPLRSAVHRQTENL